MQRKEGGVWLVDLCLLQEIRGWAKTPRCSHDSIVKQGLPYARKKTQIGLITTFFHRGMYKHRLKQKGEQNVYTDWFFLSTKTDRPNAQKTVLFLQREHL